MPMMSSHVSDAAPGLRPTMLAAAVHLALTGSLLVGWQPSAHAQAEAAGRTQQALVPRTWDIPAGPLDVALARFVIDSATPLAATPALVQGRQSPGVRGSFSAQAALDLLLAGTGLEAVRNAQGEYRLQAARAVSPAPPAAGSARGAVGDGVATLAPVRVTGEAPQETATGPAAGYVARRSATGTKTDTPLVETPRAVSVVTREQLDDQQPRSVGEALRYTPGVVAQSSPLGLNDATIGIRGFSTTVGEVYYKDGTRVASPAYYGYGGFEPYGLERLEVLRGPASVLFGQNQPGGVVNMVSKRPSAEPFHEVQVLVGSRQRAQIAADLGGAITEDGQWSYRLVALGRDSNTQIDDIADNRRYVAPSIRWKPSDRTELVVRAEYQRNEGAANNALPAKGTVLPNPNGRIAVNRALGTAQDNAESYETRSIGYQLEHRVTDVWTLRQNVRLSRFDADRRTMRNYGLMDDDRTIARGSWQLLADGDTTTVDNQVQARFKTGTLEHTVLLGVDYHRSMGNLSGGLGAAAPLDLYAPVYTPAPALPVTYDRQSVDKQTGLYLQDQLRIDRWRVSLGGRQDWSRQTRTNRLAASDATTKQKDDAVTGQAGVVYLFDSGWAPYASYSRSFIPVAGASVSGEQFKPEKGVQYEAGVKYAPPDTRAMVTLSVFDLRRRNVTTPDLGNPGESVQTGEVRSRGIELEGKANLARGLDLIAALSYLRVKVTGSNDPVELGSTPAGVPRHMASLWLNYRVLPGLTLGAGARLIGSTWGSNVSEDEPTSFRVRGYTLVDAALRYDLGQASSSLKGWQLALNVQNLSDRIYADCGDRNFCEYGIRRNGMLSASYRW